MLKLKLSRFGKKREPHYRIVVAEAKSKREGWYNDQVGYYNPISKELKIDEVKVKMWMEKGAQPTETVSYLLAKQDIVKAPVKQQTKKVAKAKKG